MSIKITKKLSKNKLKYWHFLEWGKAAGQRRSLSMFTYAKPKTTIEQNHNRETMATMEMKKSQLIIERQAVNTGYLPSHKIENNFFDFYADFVKHNRSNTNRTLECSFKAFKEFWGKNYISPLEVTEEVCERFREYLLKKYNGETPAGYFIRFKKMLKSARRNGYFTENPAEDVAAKGNSNKILKNILSGEEYKILLATPCLNHEVKKAFIVSLYTGLRWADIKPLAWKNITESSIVIVQKKTQIALEVPLHSTALAILGKRGDGRVFSLPTQDGANKVLQKWCKSAGITKHITWHCARHSFSVFLQSNGVDLATVAGMLGHTTVKYVQQTYKRFLPELAIKAISKFSQ